MIFERKALRVIVLLDHTEGAWYTKLVCHYEEEDELDQIYKIMMHNEYWINPMEYG